MEGTETLCPHATILNHRWLPGTRSRLLSVKPNEWMHLSPFYTRMHGERLRHAKSTSQFNLAFSLKVRDDWGFQVNPLCRHDITSPFPPSGNGGYSRNLDVSLHHALTQKQYINTTVHFNKVHIGPQFEYIISKHFNISKTLSYSKHHTLSTSSTSNNELSK